jgi:hypothetical protein
LSLSNASTGQRGQSNLSEEHFDTWFSCLLRRGCLVRGSFLFEKSLECESCFW